MTAEQVGMAIGLVMALIGGGALVWTMARSAVAAPGRRAAMAAKVAEQKGAVAELLADRPALLDRLAARARIGQTLRVVRGEELVAAFAVSLRLRRGGVPGHLVITNRRIHWDGPNQDWTREWAQVTRWTQADRDVVLQFANETPMRFRLLQVADDPGNVAEVVLVALEHGYELSRRDDS